MYFFEEMHAVNYRAYFLSHFAELYNFLQRSPFALLVLFPADKGLSLSQNDVQVFPDRPIAQEPIIHNLEDDADHNKKAAWLIDERVLIKHLPRSTLLLV